MNMITGRRDRDSTRIAWLILAVAAINVIFLAGKRRAFGIFVAQLRGEFKATSLTELNWIGDSYAALGYLTTSISTRLILKYDRCYSVAQAIGSGFILTSCILSAYVPCPRWLFLTHTILHGIGSSAVISTVGLVVNEHFDRDHKYHILATTLISGGSIASIFFVQFYAYLIETYTWRTSFLILGLIYFVVNISASFIFEKRTTSKQQTSTVGKQTLDDDNDEIIGRGTINVPRRRILMTLWACERVLTSIVTYGMLLNLADYKYQKESSLQKSAVLTTLFASGEAVTYAIGTLITALTKNLLRNKLRYILTVSSFAMSVLLITWEFFGQDQLLGHVLAFSTGFCLGPSITFLFPAGEEMTQLKGHQAYPFSLGCMGIGMIISPCLTAFIAERFHYRYFFGVQGILVMVKAFCLVIITCILRRGESSPSYFIAKATTDEEDSLISEKNYGSDADQNSPGQWNKIKKPNDIYTQ